MILLNNKKTRTLTKIQMELSGTNSVMPNAVVTTASQPPREMPVPREDEPNLYNLPTTIHATYQPLPILIKATVGIMASMIVALQSTWRRHHRGMITWIHPLLAIKNNQLKMAKILAFSIKTFICYAFMTFCLHETFYSPSRITTRALQEQYWLPSTFSNYSDGVHSIQFHQNIDQNNPSRFQMMHFNHGFGASSLSWLPVLPKLAQRLKIPHSIAHDAPGFGFTDRSTTTTSATIGLQLIQQQPLNNTQPILLMGHSMGALTTLQMVMALPETMNVTIVLVAPALGLTRKTNNMTNMEFKRGLFDPIFEYALKRIVGSLNFWKRGLRLAWGNPSLVSDSDALRFQWPSIGQGWEQGLLQFSRQSMANMDEHKLFQQVKSRPNTRLLIVRGTKDRVVTKRMLDSFLKDFHVEVVELQGQGHDPFEEDVELFCSTVDDFVSRDIS